MLRRTVLRQMRQDADLCQRLRLTVVCLRDAGPVGELIEADGTQVISMGWTGSLPSLRLLARLTRLLRGLKPDIVHTCLYRAHRHGIPAARLAGIPVVLMEEHGLGGWMGRRERLYSRVLARMATKILVVSHAQAGHLCDFIGYPAKMMAVIPNCIDAERLGGRPCFAPIRQDATRLTSIGTLHEEKNYPFMLRVFRQVLERLPQCRLTIVGEGPARQELERLIMDLGLKGKAVLAGQSSNIREILSATDVYVHAGLFETFCLVIAEAMYAGCACVGPRTEVLEELADHGRMAVLTPPEDTDAMAEAIVGLLGDPDTRRRMAAMAAEHVCSHYLPQHHIASLGSLYDGLTSGKS